MLDMLSDLTSMAWAAPSTETLSLPEQIAEQISNDIVTGHRAPGSRVQEQEVADRFKVSRGPVREALRILENRGLIQINARKGAQVTKLSAAEVRQIFEIRINLAGLAARLTAENGDAAFIQKFTQGTQHFAKLAEAGGSLDECTAVSYRLNLMLAESSGNPFLRNIALSLALQTLRYARLSFASEKYRQRSARTYKLLGKAIASGDSGSAQQAAEQLTRDARDAAIECLDQKYL